MNEMKRLLIALMVPFIAGCGQNGDDAADGAPEPQQWKFAIEEIEGSVQHRYAKAFEERIEARSGGRIDVVVYPYGQLGTSSQLTELVQLGSVQFAFASPGHLGAVIPETQLFSLHFAFSDDEDVNHVVLTDDEALHALLREAYAEANLRFLGALQEGWMAWTANKAIVEPADFAGVKIRTMNSPLLIRAYELYGANPTTMAYSEVYSALQLNMIDAQVNPVFAIEEMSFYEVQSHMMFPRHLPFITTIVTNPQFFEALGDGDRRLLLDVMEELETWIFNEQRELNERRREIIRAYSDIEMIELDEAQRAAFRKASLPIREQYVELAGERGARLLAALEAAIAAAQAESAETAE